MSDKKSDNKIDFVALAKRYTELGTGQQADLRRATLDTISAIPAYYRLLPGIKTDKRWDRVVFFLPHIKQHFPAEEAKSLGQQLASKISEERLFHVLRSQYPNDLIQLRRLVQQVEPSVDWQQWGERLFFWNEMQKRRLLEDYFFHYSAPKKGASL